MHTRWHYQPSEHNEEENAKSIDGMERRPPPRTLRDTTPHHTPQSCTIRTTRLTARTPRHTATCSCRRPTAAPTSSSSHLPACSCTPHTRRPTLPRTPLGTSPPRKPTRCMLRSSPLSPNSSRPCILRATAHIPTPQAGALRGVHANSSSRDFRLL